MIPKLYKYSQIFLILNKLNISQKIKNISKNYNKKLIKWCTNLDTSLVNKRITKKKKYEGGGWNEMNRVGGGGIAIYGGGR